MWGPGSPPPSSLHCELVELQLVGLWSVDRMLHSVDRREVRWVIALSSTLAVPLVLEKVKAHDDTALQLGLPKAVGNDRADAAARRAASSLETPLFVDDLAPFGDPVEMVDGSGVAVSDMSRELAVWWWSRRQLSRKTRRQWLDKLYPPDQPMEWQLFNVIFH